MFSFKITSVFSSSDNLLDFVSGCTARNMCFISIFVVSFHLVCCIITKPVIYQSIDNSSTLKIKNLSTYLQIYLQNKKKLSAQLMTIGKVLVLLKTCD